jgi:hypothetical protein
MIGLLSMLVGDVRDRLGLPLPDLVLDIAEVLPTHAKAEKNPRRGEPRCLLRVQRRLKLRARRKPHRKPPPPKGRFTILKHNPTVGEVMEALADLESGASGK